MSAKEYAITITALMGLFGCITAITAESPYVMMYSIVIAAASVAGLAALSEL